MRWRLSILHYCFAERQTLDFAGWQRPTGDKLNYHMLCHIETEIDDLLPYTVDLSLFKQIDNPDLIDHIRRVGLIFYPAR